VTGEK
jgi:hypothetical protein